MNLELFLEAERRGLLPPDKQELLDEARRRGLIQGGVMAEAVAPAKESTIGSEVVRGAKQLLSSSRTGLESILSPEEAALSGIERSRQIAAQAGEGPSFAAVKKAYEEKGLLPAVGEAVSQLPRAIAGQAPQIGATIGGAKLGAMAGAPLGPVGSVVGGIAGAGLTLLPQFMGSEVERQAEEQIAQGKPVDISRPAAYSAAGAQAALEGAGTAFTLGKRVVKGVLGIADDAALASQKARQELLKTANRSLTGAVGVGAARGLSEIPVEIAQSVISRAQAGLDLTSPDALSEYGEAAYLAGLVGPSIGGAAGVYERSQARAAQPPVEPQAAEREAMRLQQELLTRQTEIAELERQAEEARKDRVPVEKLKELKIKESDDPNSMYQQILSKDLRDPEQRQAAVALLTQAKEEVTRPKAPALTLPENYDDTIQNIRLAYGDVSQPVEGATGAGVPVAGVPGAGTSTEGVGVVETAGVVPTEQDVGEPAGREGQQPAAVKPEKKSLRGFYSALEEKVGAMGPKQAPAAQWKTMIQALPQKGVKPEEIEYSGVTDWLDTQTGKVTKEQVQNYLKEGGVQVEETVLGDRGTWTAQDSERLDDLEYRRNDLTEEEEQERQSLIDRENAATMEGEGSPQNLPKYGQYTIPGGENYREVLLRLPVRVKSGEVSPRAERVVRDIDNAVLRALPDEAIQGYASAMASRFDVPPAEMEIAIRAARGDIDATTAYRSSHWDQPNVLAHIRVNDRVDPDGKKVLFVEEIQSDWGQEGKKKGFKGAAPTLRIGNLMRDKGFAEVVDQDGRFVTNVTEYDVPGLDEQAVLAEANRRVANQPQRTAEVNKVPTAPFVTKTEGWLNLALKRIIDMAVSGGYDRVAFINGEQSFNRFPKKATGESTRESFKAFYDQIVPNALKKLLPKVGGGQISAVPISEFGGKFTVDPGPGGDLRNFNTRQEAESFAQSIGGAPVIDNTGKLQPGFDITPAMRETVSTKGQPLFSLKTAAPSGAEAAPVEEPATPTEVQPSIESVIAQKKELQAQQIVLFEQALKKVAAKYGLKDVAVKVIEDMRDANGAYSGGLIKMALDAQNPVRDIRHEAIHAMKELGFFSDQQWNTLVKRAKDEWIDTFLKQTLPNMESRYDAYLKMFQSQGMSEEQIEEAMVEEAIADAFSYFDANKAPAGLMQSILTRMRKFFKMLRDGMKGAGIESAEDIFGKIEQGVLEPTREVAQPAPTEKLSIRAPQTEAFKRWFGDSKVVDAEGNPLVVYHGTSQSITAFDLARIGARDSGFFGAGFYFTPDESAAQDYADTAVEDTGDGEAVVMPLYVSLQNPFVWDMSDEGADATRAALAAVGIDRASVRGNSAALSNSKERATFNRAVREQGYDGVIVRDEDGIQEVVAFRPEQIKSATGNIGTYSPTEPDIRKSLRTQLPPQIVQRIADTTRPRDEKTHIQRITQALGPKSWSYFRQRALNRYNQLSVYDKRRAKLMGGAAFLADQSAESAALLSDLGAGLTASALGVHDRVGGIPVFKNGITIISNMNGTVKGPVEIFAPLAKLGDPYVFQAYQFWAMVKRGKKYFAQNNQGQYVEKLLEPADIQRAAVIEAELRSKGVDVNAIQKEWIKYNDGLVKFMVDTGVLSKERAAIYTEHSDYFPFYRQLDEESQEGPRVFQGISGVKAPKAAKGSEAQVGDFFEVIVRNTQSAIQAGIKNVAAERAKKVALDIGMARATHRTSGPDVFSVLENGVPKFYESADPLFIDAIKSLNLPDLPFIGLLSGPANLLRNLVTKDPGFMLANMMRDSMSAYVTSGVKMTPVAATIKNFGSALAAKDPAFERLLNAGILGGYEFSQNVEASGRQFAKELRKASGKQTLQEQIMRPATWLWEALEKGTTASDAATRMEVYKKTLEETGNEAEAIYRAMEVMNFNRKGSSPVVRIATAAIPFLNARMQGLDVLYRAAFGEMAIKDAKALQRAFFVRGMTIAALSTMYWALTHDDDEYKRQEQETRDNYWLFPSLGIKIPIPFEVGVLFKVIPERIAALTFGTDTAKDFTESMTRNLMNTLAVNPIPQVALPTVEYVTNFSFFTFRPIVGQGLEGVAKPYQIGPGTSRAAQFLGHISKDLPEALQISPMKADALINGYTGSIGTYMSDLIDAIWDMHADSPKASKRFEQMPVIRRFLMDPDARGNVTAYYDMKNAVDRATRTANLMERSNDFEQYGEYMQANMGMFAVKDYILDLEKTMKEYREMKNMVRASNMDANTKRDMVLSITQMENQLTENIQSLAKMARD